MAVKLSDDVLQNVRGLIRDATNFTDDDENFHLCYKYALSNICNHRYLSVNRHAVKQSFDNLVLRFRVQGLTRNAQRLEKSFDDFVNHPIFKEQPQVDLQWSLLSLLVNMAGSPTTTAAEVVAKSEEQPFDWVAYLREGDVDNHYYSSDTDDEDWNLSGAEAEEVSLPSAGGSVHTSAERSAQLPLATCTGVVAAASKCDQIKQCLLSKEWLANSVQHNWWSSFSISEPGSAHPRVNAAHLWNKYALQNEASVPCAEKVNTLSEYKVVREVLFMLREPTDMRVFVCIGDRFQVRPDVTIPSLTQQAFCKLLQEMCEYFDMLKELRQFGDGLQSGGGSGGRVPPLTYKAYYSLAVGVYMARLWEAVTLIEAQVRRQEKPHTLISVKKELQTYLDDLKTVYILHKKATVFSWENSPNWLCATCMLSVVYEALCAAVDDHIASMMLAIFMKTISPYLRTANIWLTGRHLEDVSEEFIISKTDDSTASSLCVGEEFQIRPYEKCLIEKGVKPAAVLQVFAHTVLQAGRTIDFLHKMNRVAEIRRHLEPHGELFAMLSADSSMLCVTLIKRVIAAVVQTQTGSSTVDLDGDVKAVCARSEHGTASFEFPEHMRQLCDPYLLTAFGFPLHTEDQSQTLAPMRTCSTENSTEAAAFRRLDELEVSAGLPLHQLLQSQVEQLVGECHSAACKVVRHVLLAELHLPTHFSLVRHIVLGEAGDIMHDFATSLFAQVESGMLNTYALSHNLETCVDERFPEHSARFAVTECTDEQVVSELQASVSQLRALDLQPVLLRALSAMVVISRLHILYKVEWPVSLFLNKPNMRCYNKVFQFLLQVKWGLHLLNHLRFTAENLLVLEGLNNFIKQETTDAAGVLLEAKAKLINIGHILDLRGPSVLTRRLQLLRFWHMHTLSSVHTYLMGQVLQSESFHLQHALDNASDLHAFLQAHSSYVNTIYRKCFRPSKFDFIVCGVHQLVAQAYVLRMCWGSAVSVALLHDLEAMYNHTYCMMTLVLRLHVDEDFDSELKGLYSALDDRIPFPDIHL